MPSRYRCLLIDHDDTAVDSTATIHHPAHVEALRVMRPDNRPPTVEQWLLHNFDPGIMEYLVGELRMDARELEKELEIWRSFTASKVPPFFPGFLDLLRDFRAAGGRVAVVSHSDRDVIEAHYKTAGDPPFLPDLVFGWENEVDRRKPSPWPVTEALRIFGMSLSEALVVDDLKPGVDMARAAGVDVAAAGWGHRVPRIEAYMRANATIYLPRIQDLRALLF